MRIYIAVILDYKQNEVLELPPVGTSRHAAYLANEYVKSIPHWSQDKDAWKIIPITLTPHEIATLFANHTGRETL